MYIFCNIPKGHFSTTLLFLPGSYSRSLTSGFVIQPITSFLKSNCSWCQSTPYKDTLYLWRCDNHTYSMSPHNRFISRNAKIHCTLNWLMLIIEEGWSCLSNPLLWSSNHHSNIIQKETYTCQKSNNTIGLLTDKSYSFLFVISIINWTQTFDDDV